MSDDDSIQAPQSGAGQAALRRPEDATVLVVDDEPDVVTYLQSVLEDAGINVIAAHDGDTALELVKSEKIDLISLDLVMPRKSGIRLLVELRKNQQLSRIPVIFVTGHANDPGVREDVSDALAGSTMAGPAMYLEKPVTPRGYLSNICRILRLRCPAEAAAEEQTEAMRREVQDLLEKADPEALAAALRKLKGGKP